MFRKKIPPKQKMTGTKIFEYGLAGAITAICIPPVYKAYDSIFGKVKDKLSLDIDDLERMYHKTNDEE